ncbi:MAG TPA: glycosyltransferase [Crocinitomicaceae bacterium]|nr:glycosyltransferase [Crocinitomicaceae bacterium]
MSKRILFLAPYPYEEAPSQRFRFEQYFNFLKEQGYEIEIHSFLNEKTWKSLYNHGSFFAKAMGIIGSFWRRKLLMFKVRKFDYIFIHREASMIGPPIFEWFIAKVLRRKYIYDYDDAIWLPNYSQQNARFHKLKAYGKVKKIIKWADIVVTGNSFLQEFGNQYNKNVVIIPTTIDLKNSHNQPTNHSHSPVNIGWTGSHTTMSYLDSLIPILQELEKEHHLTFTIISNEKPDYDLQSLQFIKWKKETEIEDLSSINIGVMPLTDSEWAKGKCGFKALQYMALGIPALVSPVGVNTEVIEDGKNGYLCATSEEWKEKLSLLLNNQQLREQIGKEGYKTVRTKYSVEANRDNYQKLFQ